MDNIQFEKPENKGTVYFGNMLYDLNPLLLQSSRLIVKEIKEVDKQKYIVLETSPSDFSFYDTLVKLDDHILDATYQNSEEWFNKELPMDILENMYKRVTSPFKKDEVPAIQFKLPFHKENIQTKIYNQTNEIIDIGSLVPGSTIIMMIQVKGLKFLKQNYYCDICLSQIKLIKETVALNPKDCMIEEDDDNTKVMDEQYAYEILDEEIINNKVSDELSEKALADKALANKELADKALADKALADKALADKALADKALADKAEKERVEKERSTIESIIYERKKKIESEQEELYKLEEQLKNL